MAVRRSRPCRLRITSSPVCAVLLSSVPPFPACLALYRRRARRGVIHGPSRGARPSGRISPRRCTSPLVSFDAPPPKYVSCFPPRCFMHLHRQEKESIISPHARSLSPLPTLSSEAYPCMHAYTRPTNATPPRGDEPHGVSSTPPRSKRCLAKQPHQIERECASVNQCKMHIPCSTNAVRGVSHRHVPL